MLYVKVKIEKPAFQPDPIPELLRIMDDIRAKIAAGDKGPEEIQDADGHRVGNWHYDVGD